MHSACVELLASYLDLHSALPKHRDALCVASFTNWSEMVSLTAPATPTERSFPPLCLNTGVCIIVTNKSKEKKQHNEHFFASLKVSLVLGLVAVHIRPENPLATINQMINYFYGLFSER